MEAVSGQVKTEAESEAGALRERNRKQTESGGRKAEKTA